MKFILNIFFKKINYIFVGYRVFTVFIINIYIYILTLFKLEKAVKIVRMDTFN